MRTITRSFLAVALLAHSGAAQITAAGVDTSGPPPRRIPVAQSDPTLATKTITLRQLTATEATSLLGPYVKSQAGSVRAAMQGVITIKDRPDGIAEMEKVLAEYDRPGASVSLNFELIQADYRRGSEMALSSIDTVLTNVLRFTSYHLLGRAFGSTSERAALNQTIAADSTSKYDLSTTVRAIRLSANTVNLQVVLKRTGRFGPPDPVTGRPESRTETVMQTELDVPLGQSVVLGTSAVTGLSGAVVLVVKPTLLVAPKRMP